MFISCLMQDLIPEPSVLTYDMTPGGHSTTEPCPNITTNLPHMLFSLKLRRTSKEEVSSHFNYSLGTNICVIIKDVWVLFHYQSLQLFRVIIWI